MVFVHTVSLTLPVLSLHRQLLLSRYTHQQSITLRIIRPSFDQFESPQATLSYLKLPWVDSRCLLLRSVSEDHVIYSAGASGRQSMTGPRD